MLLFSKLNILLLFLQFPFIYTANTKEASTSKNKVEELDKDIKESCNTADEQLYFECLFKLNVFSYENQNNLIKQIEEIKKLNPVAINYLVNYKEFNKLRNFLNKNLDNKYYENNIQNDHSKGVPKEIENLHNLYMLTVELNKLSFDSILKARGLCENVKIRKENEHYTQIIIEFFSKLNIEFKPEFLMNKNSNKKEKTSLKMILKTAYNDHKNFEKIKNYNPKNEAKNKEKRARNHSRKTEGSSTKNLLD